MKNAIELIEVAGSLADGGASPGEIADELDVSRETASWLVRKSAAGAARHGQQGPETDSDHGRFASANSANARYSRR